MVGADDRREGQRRAADRRASGRQLVPVEPSGPAADAPSARPAPGPEATFAAQLDGQGGQRRGLKGGKAVLDKARSAYLGTEYAGEADRRPRPGRVTKTEI